MSKNKIEKKKEIGKKEEGDESEKKEEEKLEKKEKRDNAGVEGKDESLSKGDNVMSKEIEKIDAEGKEKEDKTVEVSKAKTEIKTQKKDKDGVKDAMEYDEKMDGKTEMLMIDILSGLKIQFQSRRELSKSIAINYSNLAYDTYLPIKFVDQVPQRFGLVRMKLTSQVYVREEIYGKGKDFLDYDELFEYFLTSMKDIVENALIAVKEPETIYLGEINTKNPEKLGIPLEQLLRVPFPTEGLIRGIARRCKMQNRLPMTPFMDLRAVGSDADVFVWKELCEMMNTNERETKVLIAKIENYLSLTHWETGKMFGQDAISTDRMLILPFADPFQSHTILEGVPYEFYVRLNGIIGTSVPKLILQPMDLKSLMLSARMSTVKPIDLAGYVNLSYDKKFDDEISMLFTAYFTLGYSQITIDPKDFQPDIPMMQVLICLLIKMFICYHGNNTETMINRHNAFEIDSILLNKLADMGVVRRRAGFNFRTEFIYDSYEMTQKYRNKGGALMGLRTTINGDGWLNGGNDLRGEGGWGGLFYSGIEEPPMYLGINDTFENEDASESQFKGMWTVYQCAIDLFRGEPKFDPLCDMLGLVARRAIHFFRFVNRYNRKHFYNGFRMRRDYFNNISNDIGGVYHFRRAQFPTFKISADAFLFFTKSLPNEDFTRPISTKSQLRTESCMVHEFGEWLLNLKIFDAFVREFDLDKCYPNSERKKITLKNVKKGPFSQIFESVIEGRHLTEYDDTKVENINEIIGRSPLNRIMMRFFNKFGFDEKTYGYIKSLKIVPRKVLSRVEINRYREMNIFRDNILLEDATNKYDLRGIFILFKEGHFHADILEKQSMGEDVEVIVPSKLDLEIGEGVISQDVPFELINYTDYSRPPNLRKIIKMGKLFYQYRYLVKREKGNYEEIYKKLGNINEVMVPRDLGFVREMDKEGHFYTNFERVLCFKDDLELKRYLHVGETID